MSHSFSRRVIAAPDVLFRLVGEEAVLLNLKTEMCLGLDPVGTRMWQVLTQSTSIQEAYQTLLQEYDVESARLHADLDEFVDKLAEQQLIQIEIMEPASVSVSE
jgi:hypothetical protein